MEADPNIKGDKSSELQQYVRNGNEAVEFKLVRDVADLEKDDIIFHPEMCHQVFNEGETIFGFENLKIKVYFTAGSLQTYLAIKYSRQIPKTLSDGLGPDDVAGKMNTVLRAGFTSNLDEFSSLIVKEELFVPLGELVHSFKHIYVDIKPEETEKKSNGINGASKNNAIEESVVEKTYEVYMVDAVSTPKFIEYIKRMESFILFFIDAATFLEDCYEDDKWRFFTLFEKYKTSDGKTSYAFIGYSTIYQFYTYPDLMRPRVAQMIILPPFQKQGLACNLLSCIYTYYRSNPKVKEITVEDPSDDFELLRDYLDSRDCKKLDSYAPENLKKGFNPEMAEEAHNVLKMTKRQAHRVYEILRLQITNIHNDTEFKDYRLDVKRRLNVPYQKQESDIKRMMRRKTNDNDLHKAAALDDGTRKTELESNFNLLMTHYHNILKRLEKHNS